MTKKNCIMIKLDFESVKAILKDSYKEDLFESYIAPSIKECEQVLSKARKRLELFSINEVEFLCLVLLERNAFEFLQSDILRSTKNAFQKIWEFNMDTLLTKVPSTHKKVIYRNDKYCDVEYLKKLYNENKRYRVSHFLTCSKEFLQIGGYRLKFIIHPLRNDSKAHNVYMVYNFGRNKIGAKPEWQIEFERGTEFIIKSLKQKGSYYVVHLEEVI